MPIDPFNPPQATPALLQIYPEDLEGLNPRIAKLLAQQVVEDEQLAACAPLLRFDSESAYRLGKLELGNLLAQNPNSLVFTVKNRPDLVIKYQLDQSLSEEEPPLVHPLAREWWILNVLNETGVVGKPFMLSPMALLSLPLTRKMQFVRSVESLVKKIQASQLAVRYLVMERLGLPLFRSKTLYRIHEALTLLAQLVISLSEIHDKGVVHGDIHPGNILVNEHGRLVFIDFGRSTFEDEFQERVTEFVESEKSISKHPHLSPGEMLGRPTMYVDDLFRLFMVGAFLIHGECYYSSFVNASNEEVYVYKNTGFIFEPIDPSCGQTRFSPALRRFVSDILAVLRETNPLQRPLYPIIAQLLHQASRLAL